MANTDLRVVQEPATNNTPPERRGGVEARWPGGLGKKFCPVSSFFLANYTKLKPHDGARGLNTTEAMLIIQILDFKWGDRAPFPTIRTIAERMGISSRQVRSLLRGMEGLGLLERVRTTDYGPNRYTFDGLYRALDGLMAAEIESQDEAELASSATEVS